MVGGLDIWGGGLVSQASGAGTGLVHGLFVHDKAGFFLHFTYLRADFLFFFFFGLFLPIISVPVFRFMA